jgi:20S proteasome subunit alpha 7
LEAVKHVARIVYSAHDEKDKDFECELSWICDASNGEFKRVPKELTDEAVEAAKAALEEDDDMDM